MDSATPSSTAASLHHPNETAKSPSAAINPFDTERRPSTSSNASSSRPFQVDDASSPPTVYRVYKRRFIPLLNLTLLNIIVSWGWLTYAPVAGIASDHFSVSISAVDWLATAFLFSFVVATPAAIYTLNRGGPRAAILVAGTLLFVGNWVRYGGSRSARDGGPSNSGYGVTMFGQILIGLAQPFVLSAPTRLSDMWFSEKGRIAATAVASLANPLGGAVGVPLVVRDVKVILWLTCCTAAVQLGQLINPFWAVNADDVPNMVLYVAIISTIATLPTLLTPRAPPSPPTPTSTQTHSPPITTQRLLNLFTHNPSFTLLLLPFTLYVSLFNTLSSTLTSILAPYSYTDTQSGLTGAILILAGLVFSACTSPVLDRRPEWRLPTIKILVFVVAVMYLAFVFAPQTRTVAAPYAVAALLGAASFALVPLALELLVEVTYGDVGPEVGSCVCWAGGQLGGALGIIVLDGLRGSWGGGEPQGNEKAGLVFLAVVAWVGVPWPMFLGWRGLGRRRREEGLVAGVGAVY